MTSFIINAKVRNKRDKDAKEQKGTSQTAGEKSQTQQEGKEHTQQQGESNRRGAESRHVAQLRGMQEPKTITCVVLEQDGPHQDCFDDKTETHSTPDEVRQRSHAR